MRDRTTAVSAPARLFGLALLAVPAAGMGAAAVSLSSPPLAVGACVLGFTALVFVRKLPVWRPPTVVPVLGLYLIAVCWLAADITISPDPAARVSRGVVVAVGVMLFVAGELFRTGAEPRRRAAAVCRRLLARPHWPIIPMDCRTVPEVLDLKDTLREDMSPVVRLMADPRPEIRAAGFAALEGRPHWRKNEARLVLNAAKATVEPGVRAVAAYALGGVRHNEIVNEVSGFFRDPALEVRAAAAAGLLADGGHRWPLFRDAVKVALTDPRLLGDGGLPGVAGLLPPLAVCDFTAWTGEGGVLAERACRTLLEHLHKRLKTDERVTLAVDLGRQVFDQALSTDLRVGLSRLLRKHELLDRNILDRMTSAEQPGPIRLMAAEILLSDDPTNGDGLDVLRGLGRQQNREISLSIARILQTYLGLDLGLPAAGLAPHSKQAGEVVKRVMMWASGKGIESTVSRSERPTPPSVYPGFDMPVPTARTRARSERDDEIEFGVGPVTGPQSIIR
jgi:hypothetical protein